MRSWTRRGATFSSGTVSGGTSGENNVGGGGGGREGGAVMNDSGGRGCNGGGEDTRGGGGGGGGVAGGGGGGGSSGGVGNGGLVGGLGVAIPREPTLSEYDGGRCCSCLRFRLSSRLRAACSVTPRRERARESPSACVSRTARKAGARDVSICARRGVC